MILAPFNTALSSQDSPSLQHKGLHWLDWTIIILYAFMLLGIGVFYSRRTQTSDDYLLGGRNVNPIATGISLIATTLSAITFLMIPGETIKYGPGYPIFKILILPIAFILVGYFIIPVIMRLPITSAYELLEKPLGKGVKLTASLVFICIRFLWMGLLIFLTSKVIISMMDWDPKFIPVIGYAVGLITVIYCTMGGFRAVIATDVMQFVLLFFGALLTLVFVSVRMGGVMEWIPTAWEPHWDDLVFFSVDPSIRITAIGVLSLNLTWWVCTTGSDQMAIQRFISTKDTKAARVSFFTTAFASMLSFSVLTLVGFALLCYYQENPQILPEGKTVLDNADYIFPHFIVNFLPIGITGLVVAGLLSAAMSSLSSGINSAATVIASDIVPLFRKRNTDEKENITLAKYISVGVGLLAVLLSSMNSSIPGNIVELTGKTSNLFVAPLFNLFFMALFVPFATPVGTIVGTIYGLTSAVLIGFWYLFTGNQGWSFLWIMPFSLVVSIVFSVMFSLIPTKGKKRSIQLLWAVALLVPLVIITVILLGRA